MDSRKSNGGNPPDSLTPDSPNHNSPTPELLIKDSPPPPRGLEEDFEEWWQAYPQRRKAGKPTVFKKWQQLEKEGKLLPLSEMLTVLERQKRSRDWTKDGGEYIPGPHKYLSNCLFIDETLLAVAHPSHNDAEVQITPENVHEFADKDCPNCLGKRNVDQAVGRETTNPGAVCLYKQMRFHRWLKRK